VAGVFVLVFATAPAMSQQLNWLYVNTTEDLPISPEQCLPQQVCTLRSALLKAEGHQGVITACFDPAEVPEALGCPARAKPLRIDDENYDPETGVWTLEKARGSLSFDLSKGGTIIDFSLGLSGWDGPQDNRIAMDADLTREPGDQKPTELFIIEGSNNTLAGFEIRGTYSIASIIVRRGASNNTFGPGMVWAAMPEGVGISFEDRTTVANKIIGSWCGITGDGTESSGLSDHCVRIFNGASLNTIGGSRPEDRNVLSANRRGAGVAVEGTITRDNVIQGNYIGVSLDGSKALPNDAGVQIVGGPSGTKVIDNLISGNELAAVTVSGPGTGTVIEDNIIGLDVASTNCLPNSSGISIEAGASEVRIAHNTVHCNERSGIIVRSGDSDEIFITENSISRNNQNPLDMAPAANGGIKPPVVEVESGKLIRGRACPGCRVELFTDPAGEAEFFEGSVVADEDSGLFVFEQPDGFHYLALRATMTDGMRTSPLSEVEFVPRERPTHTPFGYKTPTPRPTDPVHLLHYSYIPWASVGAIR
jgi:hypothetical protein